MRYPEFKVDKTYFKGNKKYGRTTTVTETTSGKSMAFMGSMSKGVAIENFKLQRVKGRI
jgi:hypothetical protein